jgi:hypothetical protein
MKINLCPNRDKHYSQLNNEIDPGKTCQVTSMVAGLDIGKFGLEPIKEIDKYRFCQPEDKLKFFIENDQTIQIFYKRNFNTNIPAPEWAGVMVFAVNELYCRKVVYYDENIEREEIIDDLKNGLPVYTSMKYPENRNAAGKLSPIAGHIVLIVGIDGDNLIINDPYKNHLTGGTDGFNNIYKPEDFRRHTKGYAIRYRA